MSKDRLNSTIERLTKRKNWLDKRIAENPDKDLGYDKAESNALKYAIEKLELEQKVRLEQKEKLPEN